MSDKTRNLSIKQVRAIESLLDGDDISGAAAAAGISERTLYRWMKDDDFASALREAESRAIGEATRKRIAEMGENFEVMKEIRDMKRYSAASPVRLRAAKMIDESSLKWRVLHSQETRLRELEQKYDELLERALEYESRKKF